jgi:DNA-directed RNA polymerase subunit F
MSKEKQIDEMAKTVCHLDRTCDECMTSFECKAMMYAKRFYNAGYRKASEVAEDIIRILRAAGINEHRYPVIAEIKKKYTEDGE